MSPTSNSHNNTTTATTQHPYIIEINVVVEIVGQSIEICQLPRQRLDFLCKPLRLLLIRDVARMVALQLLKLLLQLVDLLAQLSRFRPWATKAAVAKSRRRGGMCWWKKAHVV